MTVKQKDDGEEGMFFIESDNKIVARMYYFWSDDDKMVITHTEVDSEMQGKGAGKLLLAEAVSFARSKGIKIVPSCSFVKNAFNKGTEYNDVR